MRRLCKAEPIACMSSCNLQLRPHILHFIQTLKWSGLPTVNFLIHDVQNSKYISSALSLHFLANFLIFSPWGSQTLKPVQWSTLVISWRRKWIAVPYSENFLMRLIQLARYFIVTNFVTMISPPFPLRVLIQTSEISQRHNIHNFQYSYSPYKVINRNHVISLLCFDHLHCWCYVWGFP